MHKLVSFWQENKDSHHHFITSLSENVIVAKTSSQNVGDLVFLEPQKGLAIPRGGGGGGEKLLYERGGMLVSNFELNR